MSKLNKDTSKNTATCIITFTNANESDKVLTESKHNSSFEYLIEPSTNPAAEKLTNSVAKPKHCTDKEWESLEAGITSLAFLEKARKQLSTEQKAPQRRHDITIQVSKNGQAYGETIRWNNMSNTELPAKIKAEEKEYLTLWTTYNTPPKKRKAFKKEMDIGKGLVIGSLAAFSATYVGVLLAISWIPSYAITLSQNGTAGLVIAGAALLGMFLTGLVFQANARHAKKEFSKGIKNIALSKLSVTASQVIRGVPITAASKEKTKTGKAGTITYPSFDSIDSARTPTSSNDLSRTDSGILSAMTAIF